ncbi:MAG: sigma-54-dependent Fis family transcriptional regulator [Pirellulales bacterium]|nr:sigma-54-dependent Fis family transcriptional regulator [Pirellulales bacterium]
MAKLLVIDDEANVCYSLERTLKSETLDVISAQTAREGLERVRQDGPDAVILDVRLPDISGLEAYGQIREIDPRVPVIIITAHSTTETAIEAMKLGAYEYLLKPVDLQQLREVLARALELSRLSRVPTVLDEPGQPRTTEGDRLIGRSAAMQDVYKAIGRVASQDVTVLILGESGTGKELVARAVYQHSRRGMAPLLTINCAAIPETLLESELFGHEKGAFTGADRRRIGKFEQATGGTIFLDEVGDMSHATQAKLLRLLQEQRFERVGGNETIQTDVRIIAATNQDLAAAVARGRFRQDLYYRLNVFAVHVPALREHMEDLPLLVQHFLLRGNAELHKHVHRVSPEAARVLARHDWPGNVRELESTIKHSLVRATSSVLTPDCLPDSLRTGKPAVEKTSDDQAAAPTLDVRRLVERLLDDQEPDVYDKVVLAVDRVVVSEVLRRTKGNQVEAARLLGISRNTLRAKLHESGLSVEKQVTSEPDRGGR